MKVIVIIQARMGSTRLPDKVLMDINGKPMLWHVIDRVKRCENIEQIVVATTEQEEDKAIIELAKSCGVATFSGSENDVLDRYYKAAKKFNADIIVRITADCPLIDPLIINDVVNHLKKNINKLEYVCTSPSFPDGVDTEAFTFYALEKTWKEAKMKYEREHVSIYMRENSKKFNVAHIDYNKDMSYVCLSVDRLEDLTVVKEIYKYLYKKGRIFFLKDILDLLEEKPELLKINKHSIRNEGLLRSLIEEGINIKNPKPSLKKYIDKFVGKK